MAAVQVLVSATWQGDDPSTPSTSVHVITFASPREFAAWLECADFDYGCTSGPSELVEEDKLDTVEDPGVGTKVSWPTSSAADMGTHTEVTRTDL